MNGIRKTYLYVYGSQRLLDIRRVYLSAGLKRLKCGKKQSSYNGNVLTLLKISN